MSSRARVKFSGSSTEGGAWVTAAMFGYWSADAVELYAALDRDGELPLRLRLAPWRRPEDDASAVQELLSLQGRSGRLWRVAAVKLFMDGTVDGGTAWLHEPDCHGQSAAAYWRGPRDHRQGGPGLGRARGPHATPAARGASGAGRAEH